MLNFERVNAMRAQRSLIVLTSQRIEVSLVVRRAKKSNNLRRTSA